MNPRDEPRCTYAPCTITGRTRILPPWSELIPGLEALGWTRMECDDPNIAHFRAPDWMEA